MTYSHSPYNNIFLSLLSLTPLISNPTQLAHAACLHPPKIGNLTGTTNFPPNISVSLPGLEYISQYVCPSNANANVTTQVRKSEVTKDELETFLSYLRAVEMQIVDAVDSLGRNGGGLAVLLVDSPGVSVGSPKVLGDSDEAPVHAVNIPADPANIPIGSPNVLATSPRVSGGTPGAPVQPVGTPIGSPNISVGLPNISVDPPRIPGDTPGAPVDSTETPVGSPNISIPRIGAPVYSAEVTVASVGIPVGSPGISISLPEIPGDTNLDAVPTEPFNPTGPTGTTGPAEPPGPKGFPGLARPTNLTEAITTLTSTSTSTATITVIIEAGTTANGSMPLDVAALSTAVSLPPDATLNQEIVAASSTAARLNGSLVLEFGSLGNYTGHARTTSLVVAFSTGAIALPASTTGTAAVATTINDKTNNIPRKYIFDPQSTKNVAVYYGQTPATAKVSLEAQCADPNVDIVILAFIISQLDQGRYPAINFGDACGDQTAAMASLAPGLPSCPQLAGYISACQSTYGKKVLLSIGGASGDVSFASDAEAVAFADILWQLFGPPGQVDVHLRPFGEVVVDGFDFDSENNQPQSYPVVATRLRSHFAASITPQRKYYLSSAPQCPFPDASNPVSLLLLLDWVWVQFYNNPPCEIGSSGFDASVQQWGATLQKSKLSVKPRLYIGAPAWAAAGPGAYNGGIKSAKGITAVLKQAKRLSPGNFGGAMFWDGPQGVGNVEGGKSILEWAKNGLE